MNIKQKVEKILDEYGDAFSCGSSGFSTEPYVDKIDLLYRKEMEKEVIKEIIREFEKLPDFAEVSVKTVIIFKDFQ